MITIIKLTTYDLRFPTSDNLNGSDATNPDHDYSAAYILPKERGFSVEMKPETLKNNLFIS